jgi:hypothetical protein
MIDLALEPFQFPGQGLLQGEEREVPVAGLCNLVKVWQRRAIRAHFRGRV